MDNDVKGTGNHSSFGDYGYDPRTARRYMLEPMISQYSKIFYNLANYKMNIIK